MSILTNKDLEDYKLKAIDLRNSFQMCILKKDYKNAQRCAQELSCLIKVVKKCEKELKKK